MMLATRVVQSDWQMTGASVASVSFAPEGIVVWLEALAPQAPLPCGWKS